MQQSGPISLHWWKAIPNFGDDLSRAVVAHLSGRDVVHAGPKQAELWAIGSLLQVVRRNYADGAPTGIRPVIWGTGALAPCRRDFLPHVEVALLRGPVTAAILGIETDQFGDPGLLANEVFPREGSASRIGIVPHHTLADDPIFATLSASDEIDIIDPRSGAKSVCSRIAECAHVFASSLHGLVVADAYGIPSTWLEPTGQGRLKYHDYAASVGRAMPAPLALIDLPRALRAPATGGLPHGDGVANARAALRSTFPAALRAGSETAAPSAA